MKKLMFAAALAATGMTFAETYEAQVYDVTLNIKTTAAATAKLNNKANPFVEETESYTVIYRKQANATWKGLIWGCNCETIMGTWGEIEAAEYLDGKHTIKGCILWDNKTKKPVSFGDGTDMTDPESADGCGFGWKVLNAIDKNGSKVEGVWEITQTGVACDEEVPELFHFLGAGFGTLKVAVEKDEDGYRTPLCTTYISKISGNFAGQMKAPNASIADDWSGCTFCGYTPVEGKCDFAEAWDYCQCEDGIAFNDDQTAAYGTWTICYNSSLSKNLSKPLTQDVVVSIRDAYPNMAKKLPYVYAAILEIENTYWNFDPRNCDELATALALAKQNTYAAEKRVDYVSYENLKQVQIEAATELAKAEAAKDAADTAYQYAAEAYTVANGKYETAVYNQTNVNATIIYKNASGDEVTVTATGCAKITAAINEFEIYTLVKMETQIPGLLGVRTSTTWAQCKAVVAEFEKATVDAKAELVKAEQNKDDKYEAQATAAVNLVKAQDAKNSADTDLANITSLQYEAQRALDKAETAEAVAQKAYDDAGCAD